MTLTIDRRTILRSGVGAVAISTTGCIGSSGTHDGDPGGSADDDSVDEPGTDDGDDFTVETVVDGLENPWSIALLPDDSRLLVAERPGRLNVVDPEAGEIEQIDGVPDVYAAGQGGLLDVAIDPEFDDEPWLYLTYADRNEEGESTTHVGRGRIDLDTHRLEEFEALYAAEPFLDSTQHYGSRVVVGEDGTLYVTVGDRGDKTFGEDAPEHVSQDTSTELGATLRLERDGSIPEDNPFVDDDAVADAIYSYGHRNAQGMTVHPETGALWQSEHGEEDGDELNVIEAGGNYGWPVTHTGCRYGTDDPVGDRPEDRDNVVDPVYYWECTTGGFPPAGMTFYDDDAIPDWQGGLFVGNLAGQYLGRFVVDGTDVEEAEPLLDGRGWRIRDVEVGSSGELYVAVDAADAPLVEISPE